MSAKQQRRASEEASTYFSREQARQDEVQGRHSEGEASKLVGDGAAYPKASGFHADAVVASMNSAPDVVGYDQTSAPVVGAPHEAANAAFADLSLDELQLRPGRACLIKKEEIDGRAV